MKGTFLDTSFFLALPFKQDALNLRALAWQKALKGPFVTSDFVLLEVADALCKVQVRSVAQFIIEHARSDRAMTVVPMEKRWLDRGYQLFCTRPDKNWSLTDCISFEVMKDFGLADALTHDIHFEQAGFNALLRADPAL